MGVPKFYRWISERYPCLSEVLKEYQIPEFDNLYLDMNGIIHVCSHPDDANPHFRITEEKIFKDILHYIEVLFRMIKPKKTFFMAVDGVAPRAKMNQQRSRRFKTAREMEQQEKKALEKGETLPTEERFDSNCITPGTAFMTRLQEQLKYFVIHKMSTDILWRDVKVYLSGHETPGEGEHKIMDFIRAEKCKPGYDPNVRHCLYGLDADLMMLGLASHEPHMSLLREEVRFGGKRDKQKRSNAAEDTTFHLLHLSIMREYLDFEFSELKEKLSFSYDLECIINDWVLMGFLVGNDFIPHLPNIHIHDQCLPLLWDTYKEVLPTLDGYLHDYGDLNLSRFQKYMESLARYDIEKFEELFADLRWLDNKEGEASGKSLKSLEKFAMENDDSAGLLTANKFVTLMEEETIQEQSQEKSDDCPDKEKEEESEVKSQLVDKQLSEEEVFEAEFRSHKNHYYIDKMKYSVVTKEVIGEQCETYIKAIQWILHYYFHGCPSWSWFYPFHYAPYISDVQNFSDYKIEFDYGRPFLPFEQLMAVLPAASQALLPEPLRTLMTDEASPIYDFYPTKFETDLNGKQHDWEAVVLIPFIDENRLLEAMEPIVQHKLTPSESRRNSHGPHLLYTWIREPQGTYPSSFPNVFPDLVNYHAIVTEVPHDKFVIPKDKLMKGLCPGVKLDVHCVGYPTMRHIMHTAKILKASVRVFQQPSRGDNMILEVSPSSLKPTLNSLSEALVGKTTFVSWPHLIEALVVSVSTEKEKFCLNSDWDQNSKNVSMKREVHSEKEQALWRKQVMGIKTKYYETRGIAIGDTEFLLHARPLSGRRYTCKKHGVIHLEKQWHDTVMPFVYQTSIKNLNVRDSDYEVFETLEQLFSKGTDVFMLAVPSYGSQGKVLDIDPKNDGRIRIKFEMKREPDFEWLKHRKHKFAAKYLPGFVIAKNLGVSSYIVSRFTGIVFINAGSPDADSQKRVNVGLNLRFTRTGQEVPGYSKKTEDQGWLFSTQTRDILRKYIERYPEVFDYMAVNTSEPYYESEILDGLPYTLHDISQFLDELPSSKTAKVDHGTDVLDERVVQEIVKATKDIQEQNESRQLKPKIIQVRPYLLHRPLDAQDSHIPDSTATYEVFDRVVCVHHAFTVPLGYTGTVIGIHPAENPHEILYEVIFDKEFLGGLTLMGVEGRGYRMPLYTLINLSHGKRLEKNGPDHHRPTAVIKPHQKRQLSSQPHTNNAHNQPNSQSHANNAHNQPRPQRQNNRQDFKMPPRFQQQISSNSSSHDSNVLEYHSGQVGQEIMSTGNHTEPHTHGVGRGSDISRMLITDTTNNTAFVGGLNNRHDQEPPRHPATLISSNVDYQVLWQKLQQANLTGGHGAEPPATPRAPHSNSTSQSTPLQNITLDMAAKALPNLSVPPPPLPTTDASRSPQKPATGQAIDPQTLFKMTGNTRVDLSTQDYPAAPQSQSGTEGQQSTESNEFVGMMAALELKAKQEMEVKKKGTAELRQMLNIETSETTSPKKQRSSVEMLEELCRTQKWEQPQFSYTHDHNRRVRCTITFVNGVMYAGNLFDNEPKAAESAAQSALVELTPKQSTNNFNSSPNSAFTPIRNEFANGKVPSWNPYHDNHQQNYPQQQQHTAGVHHPMMQPHNQAFMPQRQMPRQQHHQAHHRQQLRHPEQLYYMPPRQQYQRFAQQRYQNHPTGVVPHHGNNWAHPNWQQQQQLMQQQQMQQQQHQGSNKTPRKHNDGYSDPSRSTERTPPKSNPFVPLQAVKHSKSPRKKTTSTSESSVDSKQQTAKADASNRTAGAADEQQPQQEQAQAKDANDTTPSQQHTQGSRTFTNSDKKKKSRRLAANFGAAKPSS